MCGRFTLESNQKALARAFVAEFGLAEDSLKARYNITPGTAVAMVSHVSDPQPRRRLELAQWGLLPWSTSQKGLPNARVEGIAERPAFRDAFAARRCLVPASGFYEWDRRFQPRKPFYFSSSKSDILTMAGLWEPDRGQSDGQRTVALVTCAAVSPVDSIHDRMPLFVPPELWQDWLDPSSGVSLDTFLEAGRRMSLEKRAVSLQVNNSRAEGPALIAPLEGPAGTHFQADLFDV